MRPPPQQPLHPKPHGRTDSFPSAYSFRPLLTVPKAIRRRHGCPSIKMPDDEEMPPERAVEPSTLGARRCSREQFPEPGPRPKEARFDRFLADAQTYRYFGLADFVAPREGHQFAKIMRKLSDT